jgi:hypothetical protein
MIKYNSELRYGITLLDEVTIRKKAEVSGEDTYEFISAVCNHFIRNPDPMIVPIYNFRLLERPKSLFGTFRYHYDMMRLGMLEIGERFLITRMVNVHSSKWDNDQYIAEIMDKQTPLFNFIKEVIDRGGYNDLHQGNVMKDEQERYRLIDLESFANSRYPLEHHTNNWISR